MKVTKGASELSDSPVCEESYVKRIKRHRSIWVAGATFLLLLGTMGSVLFTRIIARNDAQKPHESFASSSAEVASILRLAIQHEQDLVVDTAGFLVSIPNATQAEFVHWADSVRALQRYPELVAFGESVIVPASGLAAFSQHAVADPSLPLGAGGTFRVIPPGKRPFYCFANLGENRSGSGLSVGYDFCAGAQGAAALAGRDSGEGSYAPIRIGKLIELAVQTPFYRGGGVPSTVAGRRASFVGWIGMSVIPKVLLETALAGHPDMAVSLRYESGASKVVFVEAKVPAGAQHVTMSLHNGWTVETFARVTGAGVLADEGTLALLMAGIGLSVLLSLLVFLLATGRHRALVLVSEKTDELRHQALHDPLTGLPNRALITDRIEQLLARNRRAGTIPGAMYVDLDDFKNVNDTLGHAAGDQLLLAVAARLVATLRDADTIGRMGGDEFVVLIDGGRLHTAPELVAERLLEVMRQPFELEATPMPLTVTTSVGIAVGDRSSPDELLGDADVALYLAKAAGKNCYEIFLPEMDTNIRHRHELEFDLRRALQDDQFRLVYQPIYNLEDLCLVGVEALLRWEHPTLGVVQPDDFIPLLESSGQIVQVGRWVLIEACQQMASWNAQGSVHFLSVNVSGRQLDHDGIVADVRVALELSGLDPAMLTLEVTETSLMINIDRSARRLFQLKALGVQLAIDDFGTGYSSLAYLQKFPIDCLKIDRGFTSTIGNSPESKALIRTLVQLSRNLGLKTLAEGVETTEQVDHLRSEHVNQAQGFLMSRPLDPKTLAKTILHLKPQEPLDATPAPS